ncbi:MAG: HD domain-containing protein, partial [Deltaproteobacteria bacterium]|nr:HD domain-containing protein [Deltaproteobacteria bacterium]
EKAAGERIWAELLEILRSPFSSRLVRLMDQLEIMTVLFPEAKAMKGCAQNFFHHLDVWDHSLAVLESCEGLADRLEDYFGPAAAHVKDNILAHNRLPLMKMAALFHDVAKPLTRNEDKDSGRITFYGHQREGEKMADDIAGRLRMSRRDQGFFSILIREHMHVLNLSSHAVRPATRLKWFRKLKDDCVPLIILGIADMEATLGPASGEKGRENHIQWSRESVKAYYGEIKQKLERRDLIGGKDLLGLGIPPGPEMGRILRKVREAQDGGEIKDREEALALAGELTCVGDKGDQC